ncbi:MAG: SMC-Scp complex subunit ScpB, partial [Pseudomonadales bacterium]
VGHRDVPGRPALYATTKQFLDYFNLKSLEHLPALSEIKDFAELDPELELALGVGASLSLGAQADASLGAPAANDEVVANENDVLDEDPTFALDQQLDGVVPADPEEEPQPSSAQDHE